ncbi:MAG: glutathione peroxidase [Verrucomicrobiales bacterium]|nr:glutathione peroxidase [Verrucomicrobiales bacterium]
MQPTLCLLALLLTSQIARAADPLFDAPIKTLAGKDTTLAAFKGQVLLLVNTASQCGATGQYAGLQKLHEVLQKEGFSVLGFPCNDFGAQEPGSAEEIAGFCTQNYGVSFPLFEKIAILGEDAHPIYRHLTGETSPTPGPVGWNFEKFLIGRDGRILQRFPTETEPNDPALLDAIIRALEVEKPAAEKTSADQ